MTKQELQAALDALKAENVLLREQNMALRDQVAALQIQVKGEHGNFEEMVRFHRMEMAKAGIADYGYSARAGRFPPGVS